MVLVGIAVPLSTPQLASFHVMFNPKEPWLTMYLQTNMCLDVRRYWFPECGHSVVATNRPCLKGEGGLFRRPGNAPCRFAPGDDIVDFGQAPGGGRCPWCIAAPPPPRTPPPGLKRPPPPPPPSPPLPGAQLALAFRRTYLTHSSYLSAVPQTESCQQCSTPQQDTTKHSRASTIGPDHREKRTTHLEKRQKKRQGTDTLLDVSRARTTCSVTRSHRGSARQLMV